MVSAEGGKLCDVRTLLFRNRGVLLNDGIDEDKGCEEAWVHVCNIAELVAAHTVADADKRSWHEVTFRIDQVKEVSSMVIPIGIVP